MEFFFSFKKCIRSRWIECTQKKHILRESNTAMFVLFSLKCDTLTHTHTQSIWLIITNRPNSLLPKWTACTFNSWISISNARIYWASNAIKKKKKEKRREHHVCHHRLPVLNAHTTLIAKLVWCNYEPLRAWCMLWFTFNFAFSVPCMSSCVCGIETAVAHMTFDFMWIHTAESNWWPKISRQ